MASLKEWWNRFFTAIGVTVVCNITVIWVVIWVAFRIGYLDLHSEPSHEVVIDFVPFTLSLVSFVAGIAGSIRWRGSPWANGILFCSSASILLHLLAWFIFCT